MPARFHGFYQLSFPGMTRPRSNPYHEHGTFELSDRGPEPVSPPSEYEDELRSLRSLRTRTSQIPRI